MSKLIADSHAKQAGGFGDSSDEETPGAPRDSAPRAEDDDSSSSADDGDKSAIMASAMTKKVRLACSHATRHTPTDTSTCSHANCQLTPNCQLGNFTYPLVYPEVAAACLVDGNAQPQHGGG